MNLRLMSLNIRQFCPQLSVPVIKQRINMRYKQILAAEDWEFLRDSTTVQLKGVYGPSALTIAVDHNGTTVVGTGTTFVASGVAKGWMLRVGSESQPYIVATAPGDTTLTVETNYGGTTQTAASFNTFKNLYSPAVGDVSEIESIVYKRPLAEKSLDFLNRLDPERDSTGEPQYYSIKRQTSSSDGTVSFEVWPVPDADYVVTVNYKKVITDLTADTDSPLFRAEVLEPGALWDCYRLSFAVTQNPTYVGLARDAKADFEGELRRMTIKDLATASLPRRVRNVVEGVVFDDNYALDHDVDWLDDFG